MTALYLLDANVFIDANRDYYPIERVPEFWDWLAEMGRLWRVKIPQEIYEEIVLPAPSRPDGMVDWLVDHKDVLILDEQVIVNVVAQVTELGYADDLTDEEIEKIGRDPFLIPYALAGNQERRVATHERSRPGRRRASRQLPDGCDDFDVRWVNTFGLIQELDFRTNWKTNP